MYGKELILDLHECDASKFNRKDIEEYLIELCDNVIDMNREDLHWWDYEDDPEGYEAAPIHLKGTSVCQFISTSNIIMHTLDELENLYLNLFTCKEFDVEEAVEFTLDFFGGKLLNKTVIPRLQTYQDVKILQQMGYNFLWIEGDLWMWDVPNELTAQKDLANQAYGDVLCAGYGLGLVQKYLIENPNVNSVVTIEKSKEVINANIATFGKTYGKLIVRDFFKYAGDIEFDCIIGDICDDILPEYLPDYKEFKKHALTVLKPNGKIIHWGGDYFEYLIKRETA